MNKGIFGFEVFRRRRPACRAVAMVSVFALLGVDAIPALAAGFSGPVLDNINGGASIVRSTDNVEMSGGGTSATLSLVGGKSGLIDWSALNVGNGQSLNFQGGNFYNVVQGGNASQIAGTLKASGSLWIFNPAGVSFINGAQVDVGGVLAAAAAGLANHDEMFSAINTSYAAYAANQENPTWDVPAAIFGEAKGNVSVAPGTVFNGNVLLAGRQVGVAEGSAFSGDLNVAAAGKIVVDEVAGGKVSILIEDFADVDSNVNATFNSATEAADDVKVKVGGDLNVVTEGAINVKGAVKAEGDIAFKTAAKSGAGVVVSHKQLSVASGKLLQGKSVSATVAGKVQVDGSVKADGDVDIESGLYTAVNGSVVSQNGSVALEASGNVNIAGSIAAVNGAVDVNAVGDGKSVKVGWDGDKFADASVSGKNVVLTGDKSAQVLSGKVEATETVKMSGKEYVAVNGAVSAAEVVLETTVAETLSEAAGGYEAGSPAGVLVTASGSVAAADTLKVKTSGVVLAEGKVVADKADFAAKNNGFIKLSNANNEIGTVDVAGASDVSVSGAAEFNSVGADGSGNVAIHGNGADVTIKQGVDIEGNFEVEGAGNIVLAGGIKAKDVALRGTKATVSGDIEGTGDLTVENAAGTANADLKQTAGAIDVKSVTAANIVQEGGTMTAADYIKVDGEIKQVGDNATTSLSAKIIEAESVVQTGGKIAAADKIKANITQSGCEIDTPLIEGNLTQTDASDIATTGKVTGDVNQSNGVLQSKAEYNSGNLEIGGTLSQTGGTIENVGTLMLGADSSIGGSIAAATALTATDKNIDLKTGASLAAPTITAANLKTAGAVASTTKIDANVEQIAGTVSAGAVVGNVNQQGGTMTVDTSVAGNVNQKGADSDSFTAASVSGNVVQEEGNLATLTVASIGGNLEQNGGTIVAKGDSLAVSGTTTQKDGTIGDENAALELVGELTQEKGVINASTLKLQSGGTLGGTVTADSVVAKNASDEAQAVAASGTVKADTITASTLAATGTVEADTINANVEQTAGTVSADEINGNIIQNGDGALIVARTAGKPGVDVKGTIEQIKGEIKAGTLTGDLVQNTDAVSDAVFSADEVTGTVSGKGTKNITTVNNVVLTDGEETYGTIKGTLTQSGGTLNAKDGTLLVKGEADLTGGETASTSDNVTFESALSQGAGNTLNASTITLQSGGSLGGTVTASTSLTAAGKDVEVKTGGSLTAPTITSANLKTAGTVVSATKINANIEQTAGTFDAKDVEGATFKQSGGTSTADTIRAAVTQNGSEAKINATTIDGTVEQTAGAISGKTDNGSLTIKDALTQTGGKIAVGTGTLTLEKASSVAGDVDAATIDNTGMLEQNGGTITADAVNGSFKQTEGKIAAKGDTLVFGSTVEQARAEGKTAIIGADGKAVTVADVLTQTAGEINASTITLQSGGLLGGTVTAASVVAKNASNEAQAITASGSVTVESIAASTLAASGAMKADTIEADVTQTAGTVSAGAVVGNVNQQGGTMAVDISVTGNVNQKGADSDSFTAASVSGNVVQEEGNLATLTVASIGGNLEQNGGKIVAKGDSLTVSGTTTQKDGAIGGENAALEFAGKLTQEKGVINASTLTLQSGGSLGGTVTAGGVVAKNAGDEAQVIAASGTVKADTITASTLAATGTVEADTINANVEQTAGTVSADEINGNIIQNGDGALIEARTAGKSGVDVKGTIEQTKGEIKAGTLTGDLVQNAATVSDAVFSADDVTGTVSGKGTKKITAVNNVVLTDGEETYGTIKGTLNQSGGKLNAKDGNLLVKGEASLTGGETASISDNVTFESVLTQESGNSLNASTLTLQSGGTLGGTVTAGSVVAKNASDEAQAIAASGTVKADTITASTLAATGTVEADTINANVEQTAGTVSAGAVVGNVNQQGGTMTVDTSVTGNVNQRGTAADSFTAASVSGNVVQEEGNLATLAVASIGGNLEQNGGTIVAKDDSLTVSGTTTQTAGTIGSENAAVEFAGKLTQNGGTIAADTIAANDGAEISGTVDAKTSLTATGKDVEVSSTGSLTAPTITAANLKTAGVVSATTKIDANVEQTAGTVSAGAVVGNVNQQGGTMTVDTSVTGNVNQRGTAADSFTATSVSGNLTQEEGNLATLTVASIGGNLEQNGGTIVAKGDSLTVSGTTTQKGGAIGDENATVEFAGKLTQEGGAIAADTIAANDGAKISGTVDAKTSLTATGKDVEVSSTGSLTAPTITAANLKTAGAVASTTKIDVNVEQTAGAVSAGAVVGNVNQQGGTMTVDTSVDGNVNQKGAAADSFTAMSVSGNVVQEEGNLATLTVASIGGNLEQNGGKIVAKGDSLTVSGTTKQTAGTIGDENAALVFTGKLTQEGGAIAADTIAANDGAEISGTVDAKTSLTAIGKDVEVKSAGSLTAPTITAANLKTAGAVSATTKIDANVEQTAGTVSAGAVVGNVNQKGADSDSFTAASVSGNVMQKEGNLATLTVASIGGNLEQNGGTIVAKGDLLTVSGTTKQTAGTIGDENAALAFTGKLTQEGGAIAADTIAANDGAKISGTVDAKTSLTATGKDVEVKSAGSLTAPTITAANLKTAGTVVSTTKIDANVEQTAGTLDAKDVEGATFTQTGGTATADTIKAAVTQNGSEAKINATAIDGTVEQTTGAISGKTDEGGLTITDTLTQTGGKIDALTLVLQSGGTLGGTVTATTSLTATDKDVEVSSTGSLTAPTITAANLKTVGTIAATDINGNIEQNGGVVRAAKDDLTLNGDVNQNAGTIRATKLTLMNGDVIQSGNAAKIKADELVFGNSKNIALTSGNNAIGRLGGRLSELDISDEDDLSLGDLTIGGELKVTTGGSTKIEGKVAAGTSAEVDAGRNVEFSTGGQLAANAVTVKANEDITQAGASVPVSRGFANAVHNNAAIQAKSADLTAGGNIGSGTYNYVAVGGGTVRASAGKDASIAGAGSENLRIGSVSGANVSLYTSGELVTDGVVASRGNTTITARKFGGKAQASFGPSLTVNNFNNGSRPLHAIFQTKGGNTTPKIKKLPNDTIVFIDGRLAGGDIQIINKLGALEAFPVQTPELKSEQGIFGNPTFLHDELDVANPLAVGAIDFLLIDAPLLQVSDYFPAEIDELLPSYGLNPRTTYTFGQGSLADDAGDKSGAEKKDEGVSNDAGK